MCVVLKMCFFLVVDTGNTNSPRQRRQERETGRFVYHHFNVCSSFISFGSIKMRFISAPLRVIELSRMSRSAKTYNR